MDTQGSWSGGTVRVIPKTAQELTALEDHPGHMGYPQRKVPPQGHVYLIRCNCTPPRYKIGATRSPKSRLRNLITSMPFGCDVLAVGAFRDHTGVESRLHRRLKLDGKHCRGEWFMLDRADEIDLSELINGGDGSMEARAEEEG